MREIPKRIDAELRLLDLIERERPEARRDRRPGHRKRRRARLRRSGRRALPGPPLRAVALLNENGPPGRALQSSGGGTRTHNLSVNSRAHLPIELPRTALC